MNRKSFIIHIDSLCVLDELTDVQAGKLFKAIKEYHLRNSERCNQDDDTGFESLMNDFTTRILFAPFKAQFERDEESYNKISQKRREAGSKGGAPKGNQNANKQMLEKQPKQANALKNNQNNLSDSDSISESIIKENSPNGESKKNASKAATLSRKQEFAQSLVPFLDKYSKDMVHAFFEYWSELNKSETKMRFEKQPTWEVAKRLATWAKNEKFNGKSISENRKYDSEQRKRDSILAVATTVREAAAKKRAELEAEGIIE